MDVCLTGDSSIYNIEMQTTNHQDLPYRSRYYQSYLDISALKPGDPFINLPKSFVIFICTFDPFGKNRCVYTFEERCLEEDMPLCDGTKKIFLNAKGTMSTEISASLSDFLEYICNPSKYLKSEQSSGVVGLVSRKIRNLKTNRKWEERYMLFEEILSNERKEALEEGQNLGEERMGELIDILARQERYEDLKKAAKDKVYLHKLFREFNL
ncbi:PD-(D/E)XK nuclease family transposase [uncultured Roseburia sp.]|nr:PD-(D/E)XK nuclease family transposase [uncultured Roseburia sp.]